MTPTDHATTTALVTGASRGIGRELALALAGAGHRVGLLARNEDALAGVRQECLDAGAPAAVAVSADVTDSDSVGAAVRRVEGDLGPIELLVNNAGRLESAEVPIWESDPDEWWSVIETDLRGPFLLCHAVLPGMVERRRGRIVNITSGVAIKDAEVYSAYATAKTGLLRLTGAVVQGAGRFGVRAFDVAPGVVPTAMTASMPMHADRTEWTPVEAITTMVAAIAEGRADALSGRYLRAGTDDLDDLLARADELTENDARTLRLRPYGPNDPLG